MNAELRKIAEAFGTALDQDNYTQAFQLLAVDCRYDIGSEIINGAQAIVNSYEQNMIAGKKKMDKLEWGTSSVTTLSNNEFFVHFTDYLTHKGQSHTHCCKQKVKVSTKGKIESIVHFQDPEETRKLNSFYKSVGIPSV